MSQQNLFEIEIPSIVMDNIRKLNELIEKFPQFIPLPECATFLGMDRDGLRRAIETKSIPFGIAWKKSNASNRSFKIPSTQFYLWYTQGLHVN